MTDPLQAVAGRRGWIISDGKAGHEAQARGVAKALGLRWIPRSARRGSALRPGVRLPRPALPAARLPFPRHCPTLRSLSAGHPIRRLKHMAGLASYTVILLDPKVSARTADLFWVPEHDRLRGPNVITTLTAPHTFSARRLGELRSQVPAEIAALPSPRVAVLLGGPNGDYRYTPPRVAHLASALQSLGALGAGLMITPSRRTPPDVVALLREQTDGQPRFFWNGESENPYAQFLAQADAFIVPADSINMTGEPCATGKPIFVFEPEGGSAKFARFHDALSRLGATRPLPARFERLDSWTYPPLDSASVIAAEIARRWVKRRQMLGGR
jgi:mitochondrial fission protein ELM1